MQSKASISQVEGDAALYALGALSARDAESFRQRLAAGCDLCRHLLEECRGIVEMLPLAAPEAEPPAGLRSRLMSHIGADLRPQASAGADGHLVRANDSAWQDGPAAGVQYRPLHGSNTMLVRMAPNSWLPAHDHKWNEQCLVLEGSISSEGVTAAAGDFVYMPAGSVHGAIFSETGATFLIAYT